MPPAKKASRGRVLQEGGKTRRREKKNVPHGAAHIESVQRRDRVDHRSAGQRHRLGVLGPCRLKERVKSTPFAAQLAAESAARKAQEPA